MSYNPDFSALSRGKVTILVGRACLVPGVIGHCVLLEGGGLPRSPSAPRALLGVSARSSAKPSHNICGLPQPTRFVPSHLYSVISHVIPLRLLQTLNLHRWNCNVFPRSRKITVLNYVRNLSGSGLPSPAVVAARPSHRLRALRPGPIVVGSSAPSMPEAVGVLQQKPRRGAPLMVQFPPFGGGEAGSQTGVVPKVQSTSANNGKNGVLWAKWSAFWAQLCRTWCVSA